MNVQCAILSFQTQTQIALLLIAIQFTKRHSQMQSDAGKRPLTSLFLCGLPSRLLVFAACGLELERPRLGEAEERW